MNPQPRSDWLRDGAQRELLSRAAVPDRLEFVANWRKACFAAFLLAWFLYFNWSSLRVHFAPDDMMNLAYYFRAGPWRLAGGLITPWTGFYCCFKHA